MLLYIMTQWHIQREAHSISTGLTGETKWNAMHVFFYWLRFHLYRISTIVKERTLKWRIHSLLKQNTYLMLFIIRTYSSLLNIFSLVHHMKIHFCIHSNCNSMELFCNTEWEKVEWVWSLFESRICLTGRTVVLEDHGSLTEMQSVMYFNLFC